MFAPVTAALESFLSMKVATFAGLSLSDKVSAASKLLKDLVSAADTLTVPGALKKDTVVAAFGQFYDAVVSNLPIPYVPSIISTRVFKYLRPVAMAVASDVVEYAVSLLPVKEQV